VPHFDYHISIGAAVQPDMIEVPPLVLQPFVENAIWHGLGNKKETGHLHINVQLYDSNVVLITIADDGIGRAATQQIQKSHTSLGIEITVHRLKMLNAANEVLYEDLYNNGQAAGTMVKLCLHLH
jgi:Putative regulator of cell autolysis